MCAAMGERYGKTPYEVLEGGTVFDVAAADVKSTYDEWVSTPEAERGKIIARDMTPAEMQEALNRAKGG